MADPSFVHRTACPACRGTRFREVYRRPFDHLPLRTYLEDLYATAGSIDFDCLRNAEFVVAVCDDCELVFQTQVPGDALMMKLYEEWIDPAKARQQHVETQPRSFYNRVVSEVASLVATFDREPATLRFLDFGMGWGEWLQAARAFGVQACGFELSPSRIAHARAQGLDILNWQQIRERKFDLIYADQVFEHLDAPLDTLQALVSSLAEGGMIKLGVPSASGILRNLRGERWDAGKGSRHSLNAISPLEHINCFNRDALLGMAARAGLVATRVPLRLQYSHLLMGGSWAEVFKSLARPVYRDVIRRGNHIAFRRA